MLKKNRLLIIYVVYLYQAIRKWFLIQTNKTMTNSKLTIAFLNSLDSKTKNSILSNIANHYGITENQAYEEVIDEDAESIMDYITGSIRTTVSLFFNQFKLRYNA
jgi:hypothetical protein